MIGVANTFLLMIIQFIKKKEKVRKFPKHELKCMNKNTTRCMYNIPSFTINSPK